MIRSSSLTALMAACWALLACEAFVTSPPFLPLLRRQHSVTPTVNNDVAILLKWPSSSLSHPVLWAGLGRDKDSGGGAALAKPEVKIGQKTAVVTETKQKVQTTRKAKTSDPVSRREEEFQEAPLFKLMLLQDDGYDSTHVVQRLCAIVDDMDEDQAVNVFQQAQQEGKAMCGKYPFERAELFKEQLLRSDPMIFSDLEEENKREDKKR